MMKVSFPDRGREYRTEPVPPVPNRLAANIDAPLEQEIFDLPQRPRTADIHHRREADHVGRAVELTEGIAQRRRLRNLAKRLKLRIPTIAAIDFDASRLLYGRVFVGGMIAAAGSPG